MKRPILAILAIVLFSNFLFADEDLRLQPNPYTIVKDKSDKNVKDGTFVITGVVKGFSSNLPLQNVLIGCLSSGIWVRSDKDGKFEVTLQASDSVVYFYKEGWSEVVIEDYEFKAGHKIEMDVYLAQPQPTDVKRKPVIYMYADKDLDAEVKLDPKGEFTFTYPAYNEGWNLTVNKNGGVDVSDKNYPYLFWEAESPKMHYNVNQGQIEGFLFESRYVTEFFEDKLTALGLTQQEQTDFITYWGPLLSHKQYAFVQFVIDDDYNEQIASLEITPQPDNMRRVYILCSGLDNENIGLEVKPQNLESFERNGFTVVEWGGTILDMQNLTP